MDITLGFGPSIPGSNPGEGTRTEVGNKIKVFRAKQGLTQDALARKCDIPYTTLTKIESNVITKPSIQTVMKIAEGLGISIDNLIK